MNAIIARIAELREHLGLNQVQFAARISISSSYFSRLSQGNRTVNDRLIKLVCAEFNVSERWLRTGEGEMFMEPKPPVELSERDVAERYILNALRQLTPEYRAYFRALCEKFLREQDADANA
ncbi:MAG: helix-turn-helix transcriptional regulator [Thermoguttaceae bacterium]|nr:helix-turn-helix transcriptional regulator [Thermoguttaceae bacterium]